MNKFSKVDVFDEQVMNMDAKVQRILDLCLVDRKGCGSCKGRLSKQEEVEEDEEEEDEEEEEEEEEGYQQEYIDLYQEEYPGYQDDDSLPSMSVTEKVTQAASRSAPCRPTPPSTLRLAEPLKPVIIDREGSHLSGVDDSEVPMAASATSPRKKRVTLR